MAKKKKSKNTVSLKLVTPQGHLMWPKLFEPDTRFSEEGRYQTDIVLQADNPKVQEFVQAIKDFQKEEEAGPHLPFKVDDEAGTITLRCKTMEPPTVVDAKKGLITKDPKLGNGTVARVSVAFVPYEMQGGGLTCYIQAVQILEIKKYNPGVDAFDEEEGYDHNVQGDEGNPQDDDRAGDIVENEGDAGVSDDEF